MEENTRHSIDAVELDEYEEPIPTTRPAWRIRAPGANTEHLETVEFVHVSKMELRGVM